YWKGRRESGPPSMDTSRRYTLPPAGSDGANSVGYLSKPCFLNRRTHHVHSLSGLFLCGLSIRFDLPAQGSLRTGGRRRVSWSDWFHHEPGDWHDGLEI